MIWRILLVAAAYYASGRLGLLLAIPPGYATAVWPPSGIALAAVLLGGWRLAPGVWLGSFALNLPNGLDTSSLLGVLDSLPLPGLIATGAFAQACAGAWAVRRFVGYRNPLEMELQVLPFLIVGGPLACLIGASVGVGALHLRGLVPLDQFLINWWTWWIGDSIGVLIFTPLVLIWSARPLKPWLRRQLQVTLPLAALFMAVVWLFVLVSGQERSRIETRFERQADELKAHLDRELEARLDSLRAVRAFCVTNQGLERAEFENFVRRVLSRRPDLLAVSWNPVVPATDLSDFEARQRSGGLPGYRVWERDQQGQPVPVAPRQAHVPVAWIVPRARNDSALGFDLRSEPHRTEALERAVSTGAAASTPALDLIQGGHGQLVLLPAFREGAAVETPAERQASLQGFVSGVLLPEALLASVLGGRLEPGYSVTVSDVTAGPPLELLQLGPRLEPAGQAYVRRERVNLAGRVWELETALSRDHLQAHRSWEVFFLLAGGMLFTGLLGMLMLVITGHGTRVESLVEERTQALVQVNRQLAREVARSEKLESAERLRADQLDASNRELEQFAFAVSHDLQAPLRNIQSFIGLIERRHGTRFEGEAREYLDLVRGSAADMRAQIEGLLQISRVNTERARFERVASAEALDAALANLRTDLEARAVQLHRGHLPEVVGDLQLLTQLFQNLVANAIKFQREGAKPEVSVGAELVRGEWRFTVTDNGIGISEKNIPRLFQIFKRLHTVEEYPGTGIGLALCRKIVLLHGGQIGVQSRPGEGSEFFFTLPLAGSPAPGS